MKFKKYVPLIVCLSVVACAQKYETVTPDVRAKMMADLKSGNFTLECTLNCTLTWFNKVKFLHTLDLSEQWEELAVETMQVGYRMDLAYYYLGQAAQGLGYHQAAIKYYKYSASLASGVDQRSQCAASVPSCQGVDLASDIPALIQVSLTAQSNAPQSNLTNSAPKPSKKKPASDPGWVTPSSPTQ